MASKNKSKINNKYNDKLRRTNKNTLISKLIFISVITCYLIYLIFIVMTRLPYLAENYSERSIPDNIEYHLTFYSDGEQTHYKVQRNNKELPGYIDINYYPETNKLQTNLQNIKNLSIDCRSMYYDECKDVFGFDPVQESSNYYKWYFIEKKHLSVILSSDSDLKILKFCDAPKPEKVYVDDVEWPEGSKYSYLADKGIALSNITKGNHLVDIYFTGTSNAIKSPVAIIKSSKTILIVNETVDLDGSNSYDTNINGIITNYFWDFGDGNFITNKNSVKYSYTKPGYYGVILSVINKECKLGFSYLNITVINSTGFKINSRIQNIELYEDSPRFELNLYHFEPTFGGDDQYHWYITGENRKLYSISGENSSDHTIYITPLPDQAGFDFVELWLMDNNGNRVSQGLWINITPINDPPKIFGIPDITLHFDVPYEFNYLPYITDIDTPINYLVLNTSEEKYTSVNGLNVSYKYPKSMLGEIEYVILTVWDGEYESSDVVAVWITDDWVPNLVKPLPDVYLEEGEVHKNYFDLDEYFMDPDNDTLYYSYGYTHVNVVINSDHTVDFYAPKNWNGQEMTTFRATDPSGALIEDIIIVEVIGVNDPPNIQNVPNLVVKFNMDYIFDVSPYISDEDNEMNELILTTSKPDRIRISEEHNLCIIVNYPYRADIPYTDTVKLTVSDGLDSDFQLITIFVKANYPPVLIKHFPKITMFEDIPVKNKFNLYEYFFDNDSSIMYFSTVNQKNIFIHINLNGSIDINPFVNWSGHESITIRAQDPESAFVETMLDINILPVNDPPVLMEIPHLTFNKSEKYKLDLRPFIYDIDNNITQLKLWLEDCEIDYEIYSTKIIFYTTKGITSTSTLYVSDGQDTASQKILITVLDNEKKKTENYFELLLLFVIISAVMFLGISVGLVKKFYGNYKINEIFVIYRNGCLIFHQSIDDFNRDDADADIISAMFTAIQDFTRDSFANLKRKEIADEENWRLKKMEFKNNNVILERGDLVFLAIVFSGRMGKKLEVDIRKMRREIENKYTKVLLEWDGDMEQLEDIHDIIDKYNFIPKNASRKSNFTNIKKQFSNLQLNANNDCNASKNIYKSPKKN